MLNSLFLAFAMYSKIPVPRADWSKEKMKYVMCFFPLIGVILGFLMWGFGILCSHFGLPELFRSAGLTLIPLFVTGGIHMDGFLDTTDALSSWQPKEKKLEILKDSHTGAFAIIYCGIYLVACLGIYAAMPAEVYPLMAVIPVLSRAFSGMSVVTFKNARKDGLLATFSTSAEKYITRGVLSIYLAVCAAVLVWLSPVNGALTALTGAAVFAYYRYRSYKEFGGITGDLAGWFLQIAEAMMGLVLCLSWYILK